MTNRDFIYCATPVKEQILVGRDFIACSTSLSPSMKKAFATQRAQAKLRNISFEFTFDQWASTWLEQDRWSDRGTRNDQYVMSRLGDEGAYAPGNIKIATVAQNVSEAQIGRKQSLATRQRHADSMMNREVTAEHRNRLSAANKGTKPWGGVPCSNEIRAHMSAAATAAWARRHNGSVP